VTNEQSPIAQDYTWVANSDCDQFSSVSVQDVVVKDENDNPILDSNGNQVTRQEIVIIENTNCEEGRLYWRMARRK